jgi:hypothetical protein
VTKANSRADTRLADATLKLLATRSWEELTLASAMRAAKLSWNDIFECAPSKSALVGVLLRRTAEQTAGRYRPDRVSQSARERVFDAVMTWFDVQQAHKKALKSFYGGLRRDPFTLLSARGEIIETAEQLLALAEADVGPLEPARAAFFAGVLARATLMWLDDDEEMGKTMAQLDSDLRRLQRILWRQKISRGGAEPRKNAATKPRRTQRK